MSATLQEPERLSSFTSNKSGHTTYSRSSVYQTNGKPLSEEAIYKAKLKYGVYNKPGAPMLGVTSSASDSAALLATQTDLTIAPYKRNLSAEAATAALVAKTDSAPKAWKRENYAPDAEYAAISAKSIKFPFNTGISIDEKESSDAASTVLKKSSSSIAREALEDLYAFDEVRSGHQTFTKFDGQTLKNALEHSVADSLSKRANPTLDYRSGLTTKSSLMKMNMNSIHTLSSQNASKSMTSRTAPDHDYSRAGLYTKKLDTANGAVDISKINLAANEKARKDVLRRLDTSTRDHRRGIPTASDFNSKTLASSGADLSLHNTKFADYASYERDSLKGNTLVDKKVYAYAAANAGRTISKLNEDANSKNMFLNREMNLKALEIVQANLLKRSETTGKINLGGGLFMDPLELQTLATSLVKPVLSDIDNKANAQRKSDFDRAKLQEAQKQKKIQYKEEQRRKRQQAIQDKEDAKKKKREELEQKKQLQKKKQQELTKKKVGEVDAKGVELDKQTTEHDAEKETILGEKLETEKLIEDKETLIKTERDAELKLIQEEKDADVAPILEEYNKETALLDELISKREAAEKLALEQQERATKAETELKELNDKLEETESEIAKIKEELITTKSESEKHSQEAELLQKETEVEVQNKQIQEQEFITNNEKLKAEKTDLQSKRSAALVDLHTAKKAALLDELAINDALPEHLQKEVNQDLSDEEALDEDQFNTTEEEELEPETDVELEAEVDAITDPVTKKLSTNPNLVKSLVDVVPTASKLPKTKKTATPAAKKKVTPGSALSPTKKESSWKKMVKNMLGTNASSGPSERKPVVKTTTTIVAKPVKKLTKKPTATAPVTKEKISDPVPVAKAEEHELQQTFSGFSQGSVPEEELDKKDEADLNGSVLGEDESTTKQKESLFKEDI